MKRSIGSTISATSQQPSMFASTVGPTSTGGLLYPYLKHILYAMHLIYEECKLYHSLETYCKSLVQIQYLLANELCLTHYMNYYECEFPFLLKLKSMKVFSTSANQPSSSKPSVSFDRNSSYLSNLISQEPPVLYKFLLNLIEEPADSGCDVKKKVEESPAFFLNSFSMDSSVLNQDQSSADIINPFPIISAVTKRTIKTIKIYALIALCTRKSFKKVSFNELLNQLFFKVNFSG